MIEIKCSMCCILPFNHRIVVITLYNETIIKCMSWKSNKPLLHNYRNPTAMKKCEISWIDFVIQC